MDLIIDVIMDYVGIIDLAVIIIAIVLASNVIILCASFLLRFLEERLRMAYVSRLIKGIVLFLALVLPLYMVYLYYSLTIVGVEPIESEDFRYMVSLRHWTFKMFLPRPYRFIPYTLLGIWALGVLWTGIIPFFRNRKVLKELEQYAEEISDPEFAEASRNVLKNGKKIKLYRSEFVPSPFLWGILNKRIFLPAEEFAQKEKALIYQHELIHCKRQDYTFRRIFACLCAVYWFNPGVYLFAHYFADVNEMACDDAVLAERSNEDRRLYALLLYRISVQDKGNAYGAVSFTGFRSSTLERRIKNMKRKKKKREAVLVAITALTILILCPAIAYGASKGILEMQDKAVSSIMRATEPSTKISEAPQLVYEEFQEEYNPEEFTEIQSIVLNPRGGTTINLTLTAGDENRFDFMHFDKGAKVHLFLSGDNTSDTFQAGLVDSNNNLKGYISQGGTIEANIVIEEVGDYAVFVKNTGSSVLNVTGMLLIY